MCYHELEKFKKMMSKMIKAFIKWLVILLFVVPTVTVTAKTTELYLFPNPQQELRFQQLLGELRCLVCQNQSLAESNAPLAQDLKSEVYQQIQAGYSNDEIKQFLVRRYGEYILFKPSVTKI